MLALSQTSKYAIVALSCLDGSAGTWMLSKEIAARTVIPAPYLSRVLNTLRQAGLVHAKRGYRGGFLLARPAGEISLLDVIEAVEGARWLPECLLGLAACSEACGCPTRSFWEVERARIKARLGETSLAEVAAYSCSALGPREPSECDEPLRRSLVTSGGSFNVRSG